jgi:hypothetical protein
MCALWPFDEGPRFVLPVFPLGILYVWRGVWWFREAWRERPSFALHVAGTACVALALLAGLAKLRGVEWGAQRTASLAFWSAGGAFYLLLGLRAGRVPRSLRALPTTALARRAGAVVLALLVLAGGASQLSIARANMRPDPTRYLHYPSVDAARWIAANTREYDAVMATHYAIVHRICGRLVVPFPVSSDPVLIHGVQVERGVSYLLVLDQSPYFLPTEEERLRRLEESYPGSYHLAHRGPRYRLFERTARQ